MILLALQRNSTKRGRFFNKFYETKFLQTKSVCEDNPLAKQIIEYAKNNFKYVILATNPLFPKVATLKRMSFVNLDENDFSYITTYENSRHCKPNPDYYREILEKTDLEAEECLMVGNDEYSDIAGAARAGMDSLYIHTEISPEITGESKASYAVMDGDWRKVVKILTQ